ncbi:MAG: hypothetical protein NVSMB27_12910 [Ktedonobacteraceae bacterium]
MEGITLQEHFASLEDPRIERIKRHQLLAINTVFPAQQIAIDGKTARRSHDRGAGKAAIQTVSA